ncbi:uncharacterized protein LOC141595074 [Silene latifolia]|uniref:uncharacterized protein LOC141595074 n=1 Tax=Silene latifolia TaxID=37657 RepID=UPI003D786DFF
MAAPRAIPCSVQSFRSELKLFDPEPERTLCARRNFWKEIYQVEDLSTLDSAYAAFVAENQSLEEDTSTSAPTTIITTLASHSEPTLASLPKGFKLPTMDTSTFEIRPSYINLVERNLFGGGAAEWLRDLDTEAHGIKDWNSLALAFYKRYFPPQKTNALRSQITSFKHGPTEDFNEAWVCFKRLVQSVPHHGFHIWFLSNQFYNGRYDDHRALLDSAANGRFQDNTNDANAWKIIDQIATQTTEYGNPIGSKRGGGSDSAIATQLEEVPCERCGAPGYVAARCMSTLEQVHAYQSFKQGTPYSNFFAERNQNGFHPTPPPANPYIIPQNRETPRVNNDIIVEDLDVDAEDECANEAAETYEKSRSAESFGQSTKTADMNNEEIEKTRSTVPVSRSTGSTSRSTFSQDRVADTSSIATGTFSTADKASISDKGESKATDPPVVIKVPFPGRLKNTKVEQQFGKFLEVVKNLQVTVPFTELITQIPPYAKFTKEILSRKRSFDEIETIAFTEECSALL